jgi:hypothetical protein
MPPDKRDLQPVNAFVCLHRLCEHHTRADSYKLFAMATGIARPRRDLDITVGMGVFGF